ncbi:Uncharacterised protein (plasmid) [Tsukamurella tyrosinosolvens]|uniref:Uncharacterized protein n=1 Tax=Tsukamurella tyrosinosolvens TaxID=57704 RepID=A0A1H4UAC2_TSUTY|nr:hypothetical protein [Tsukamurella tyrosinosolvens]KXO92982.1 hypothetical protein AXK58_14020 [Tsukamurella tyrosinosolvens]SEC65709.1 hypothetical protein SAMN04489793_2833 [Tsukamurella tyrosinosolvens]VEH94091.1 Uncharacterised protein [Tsukamurella tyrosinosolvens]
MLSATLLVTGIAFAYAAVAVAVYDAIDRVEDLRLLAKYEEHEGRKLTDAEIDAAFRSFAAFWVLSVPLVGIAMLIEWMRRGGPPPNGW